MSTGSVVPGKVEPRKGDRLQVLTCRRLETVPTLGSGSRSFEKDCRGRSVRRSMDHWDSRLSRWLRELDLGVE